MLSPQLLFGAVVLILMMIFFYQSTPIFEHALTKELSYKNLPKITLVTRASSNPRLIKQFYCMYLRSVVLFWPGSYGGMAVVLDQESKPDETWGSLLKKQMTANFPNTPLSVYYEPLPNDTSILKNHARSLGYNRQLWSTFFADFYTDSPIIAYMDTDTQFVTPMTKVRLAPLPLLLGAFQTKLKQGKAISVQLLPLYNIKIKLYNSAINRPGVAKSVQQTPLSFIN